MISIEFAGKLLKHFSVNSKSISSILIFDNLANPFSTLSPDVSNKYMFWLESCEMTIFFKNEVFPDFEAPNIKFTVSVYFKTSKREKSFCLKSIRILERGQRMKKLEPFNQIQTLSLCCIIQSEI